MKNNNFCAYTAPNGVLVRAVREDTEVWMVARDVSRALGYQNPSNPIKRYVPASCTAAACLPRDVCYTGVSIVTAINEEGLHLLLGHCKSAHCSAFREWFTETLKPTLLTGHGVNGSCAPIDYRLAVGTKPRTETVASTKPTPAKQSELNVFSNPEFGTIRTLVKDGEPWFVGKDVAERLGYAKPENAVAAHVDSEDKTTTLIQGTGSNYKSKAVLINESGLYSLILSSKLPKAKQFKRWVTSEVIPEIRKTGAYQHIRKDVPPEPVTPKVPEIAACTMEYISAVTEMVKAKQKLADTLLPIYQAANYAPADLAAIMYAVMGQDINF